MDLLLLSWTSLLIFLSVDVSCRVGFTSTDCNVKVEAEGITISSPNFPYNYMDNARCWYVIHAPLNHVITLEFKSFEIEEGIGSVCRFDRLLVYDDSTTLDTPVHTLCGYNLPPPIMSTSNTLTLVFESDDAFTHSGFQAVPIFTPSGDVSQQETIEAYAGSSVSDVITSIIETTASVSESTQTTAVVTSDVILPTIERNVSANETYADSTGTDFMLSNIVTHLSATLDMKKEAVSIDRYLPFLAICSLIFVPIVVTVIILIIRKKYQNAPSPNKGCIHQNACASDGLSVPVRSSVTLRRSNEMQKGSQHEKSENAAFSIDYYSRRLPPPNQLGLQGYKTDNFSCSESHMSYYCNDFAINHSYSNDITLSQTETDDSELKSDEIKHIYNEDDLYEKIA